MRPILVGVVLYDPKVSTIWEIITRYFESAGCAMDCVFYTNYALQADALLAGHIDIAWNSPLAWLDVQRRGAARGRAIAMRDTDRDRRTHLLVRRDSGVASVADLRGRVVALGAVDSPQATLLPLHHLRRAGLVSGKDFVALRHDVLVGKHGDHVGGERKALEALVADRADAAAVLDLNWELWRADGTADPAAIGVLSTTDPFDHCNFSVMPSFDAAREAAWTRALLAMDYRNPEHREMMDLEGLGAWLPGRTSGYVALAAAVEETGFFAAQGST